MSNCLLRETGSPSVRAASRLALREGLRTASFIEGKNLWIDWDGYGLRAEQFDKHAAELVKTGVDLIAAGVTLRFGPPSTPRPRSRSSP